MTTEKKQLKYKVGDKLMGYAEGIGMDLLVAGTVAELHPSTMIGYNHEYNILLDPRIVVKEGVDEGKKEKIDTWRLSEGEAVPFNEERFTRALVLDLRMQTAKKMARESYIEMLNELYPERYAKNGEDK